MGQHNGFRWLPTHGALLQEERLHFLGFRWVGAEILGLLPELHATTTKLPRNAPILFWRRRRRRVRQQYWWIFRLRVREWIQSNLAGVSSNSSTNRADAKKWTTVFAATGAAVLSRREKTNRRVGRTCASWRSEQTETRNALLLENARRIQILSERRARVRGARRWSKRISIAYVWMRPKKR